ncbi:MAG: hypothetical protein B6I31_05575, partial [Desulfobacteraceae bacterium 4572_19]
MVHKEEEEKILQWNNTLSHRVKITLLKSEKKSENKKSGNNKYNKEFQAFCKKLSKIADNVEITEKNTEDANTPLIQVMDNIFYKAIPLGKELLPFLNVLENAKENNIFVKKEIRTKLEKIDIPVFLKLYIAQACPHCPLVVNNMISLAVNSKMINLEIIDGTLFTEDAKSDSIMSVPVLLLDDVFRWTGQFPIEEVVDIILNRDNAKLGVSSLKNMLEEGSASKIAQMMIKDNMIFPAFIELLIHKIWSVRLGAIVVIEELVESAPQLALSVADPILQHLPNVDNTAKGDILYVLGEIGNKKTKTLLDTILNSNYDADVKDAAKDAIESIEQRF